LAKRIKNSRGIDKSNEEFIEYYSKAVDNIDISKINVEFREIQEEDLDKGNEGNCEDRRKSRGSLDNIP